LFAEVENFLFYDFFSSEGYVSEDVFAYSNRRGGEASLVVYHNRYATAKGWVKNSVGSVEKTESGDKRIVQKTLGEGLGLVNDVQYYTIFRDQVTNLEYVRPNLELCEKGLYAELEAYKCHVFLNFRQVQDNEWGQYRTLCNYLNGRGVPSLDEAMREIFLQPVHTAFRELVNPGYFHWVMDHRSSPVEALLTKAPVAESLLAKSLQKVLDECAVKTSRLLGEIKRITDGSGNVDAITGDIVHLLENALSDVPLPAGSPAPLFAYLFTAQLGRIINEADAAEISRSWIDEWLLGKFIVQTLRELGMEEPAAWRIVTLVKILVQHGAALHLAPAAFNLQILLADLDAQAYIGVNRYQGILWFNKESFEELIQWLYTIGMLIDPARQADLELLVQRWQAAADASAYQLEKLLASAAIPTLTTDPVSTQSEA
jgi:hypothetical protein